MGSPPLSVVMPVHNALPFLDASIQSILDQTFPDFEFVILNDASIAGSKVKTQAVGQKYVGQHSLEGFCVLKSANGDVPGDEVRAEDLCRLITQMMG